MWELQAVCKMKCTLNGRMISHVLFVSIDDDFALII